MNSKLKFLLIIALAILYFQSSLYAGKVRLKIAVIVPEKSIWGKKFEIYITTAGVLNNENFGSIGKNKVTIPSKYYKVIYSPKNRSMIGFLMPNIGSSSELKSFVVSVDSIESVTGIDFFHELPDRIENELESEVNLEDWKW